MPGHADLDQEFEQQHDEYVAQIERDLGAARAELATLRSLRLPTTLREMAERLDDINGAIDRQITDEMRDQEYDAPEGFEFSVNLTAEQVSDINALVLALGKLAAQVDRRKGPRRRAREYRFEDQGYRCWAPSRDLILNGTAEDLRVATHDRRGNEPIF